MFYNVIKNTLEADPVEEKRGRWFIKLGFCGFNSAANNRGGYSTAQAAKQAIRCYEANLDKEIIARCFANLTNGVEV